MQKAQYLEAHHAIRNYRVDAYSYGLGLIFPAILNMTLLIILWFDKVA